MHKNPLQTTKIKQSKDPNRQNSFPHVEHELSLFIKTMSFMTPYRSLRIVPVQISAQHLLHLFLTATLNPIQDWSMI